MTETQSLDLLEVIEGWAKASPECVKSIDGYETRVWDKSSQKVCTRHRCDENTLRIRLSHRRIQTLDGSRARILAPSHHLETPFQHAISTQRRYRTPPTLHDPHSRIINPPATLRPTLLPPPLPRKNRRESPLHCIQMASRKLRNELHRNRLLRTAKLDPQISRLEHDLVGRRTVLRRRGPSRRGRGLVCGGVEVHAGGRWWRVAGLEIC